MVRRSAPRFVLLAFVLVAFGCASSAMRKAFVEPTTVEVAAGQVVEETLELRAGDRIAFRFLSTGLVDFEVASGEETARVVVVRVEKTRGFGSTFDVQRAGTYVMRWTSRSPRTLEIEYVAFPAE